MHTAPRSAIGWRVGCAGMAAGVVGLTLLTCTWRGRSEGELGTAAEGPVDEVVGSGPVAPPSSRPLPHATDRPLGSGPLYYVDATGGDDSGDGSARAPWKTLDHAVGELVPGDTLCARGGVYYEHVTVRRSGTARRPITIRSCPGELAVIDGGLREFSQAPAEAWERHRDGAEGEYRSTRTYDRSAAGSNPNGVAVLGRFEATMLPLFGYRHVTDLRSSNETWRPAGTKSTDPGFEIYVGPGLWFDRDTGRIHARLAPHGDPAWGPLAWTGESDPRKVPLVVAIDGVPLSLRGVEHVEVQDLVVRGGVKATVELDETVGVSLDGLAIYGGAPALKVARSRGLRVVRSVVRGLSSPWSTRAAHKYRGNAPYLVFFDKGNEDVELAYSEFTDGHDGLQVGAVKGLRFHHNVVDNFDDDAITLDSRSPGGDLRISENRLSRSLSTFAFAGSTNGPLGGGVYVHHNIVDLRCPTLGGPPAEPGAPLHVRPGHLFGAHGSPRWQPLYFYNNTVLSDGEGWRGYYAAGSVVATGDTTRRVLDNIFTQDRGLPGLTFATYGHPEAIDDDLEVNGNLSWGFEAGPSVSGDFFEEFRGAPDFARSRRADGPGWTAHDLFADPGFVDYRPGCDGPSDLRLRPDSPAIGAGVPIPAHWPEPASSKRRGARDIGALPAGAPPLRVGPDADPSAVSSGVGSPLGDEPRRPTRPGGTP